MIKRFFVSLTTASALLFSGVSMAHAAPMPTTPITKILAIGTFRPGTDMQLVQQILPTEARETAQLYLDGKNRSVVFTSRPRWGGVRPERHRRKSSA
jgi:hypothetical protein